MKILIDNGHGIETPGKRSPDGVLREYAWNRLIASHIVDRLLSLGLDAELLVPEERDISLPERCRRVNAWCRQLGKDNVIVISIHANAAGHGDRWYDATGWCAYTSRGNTRADALATSLYQAAQASLPGHRLRTENLFMDNHSDCAFLLSLEGQQTLIDLHVDGIRDYISQYQYDPSRFFIKTIQAGVDLLRLILPNNEEFYYPFTGTSIDSST